MNVFERRDRMLQNNLIKFAYNIRPYYTLAPDKVYIEMDLDLELIKNIDYWQIPTEQLTEYCDKKAKSDYFDLINMEIISIPHKKVARLRYMGIAEETEHIFRFTPSSYSNERIFINETTYPSFGLTVHGGSINSIVAPADSITTLTDRL